MKKQDENEIIDDEEDYEDMVDSLYKEANLHFQDENGMRELLLKKYPNVRGVIEDRKFNPLTKEEVEVLYYAVNVDLGIERYVQKLIFEENNHSKF